MGHRRVGWLPAALALLLVLVGCALVVMAIHVIASLPPRQLPAATDIAYSWRMPQGLDGRARDILSQVSQPIALVPRAFEDVTAQMASAVLLLDTGSGQGTGVVVHEDGYVLTGAHVVEQAGSVRYMRHDGQSGSLRLLAEDRVADVALLRGPQGLSSHVRLGDSESVRAGEEVGVAGYPLGTAMEDQLGIEGRSPSFTKGVVSAIRLEGDHVVFQLDASITSGYSGGPVFRAATGEVIGLVTGEVYDSLGSTGICFAVGINSAKELWE